MKPSRLLSSVLALLFSFGLTGLLFAKAAVDHELISFNCLSWTDLDDESLYYLSGGEYCPVVVTKGARSSVYSMEESERLEIFTKDEGGEFILLGSGALPEGVKRIFCILQKGDDLQAEGLIVSCFEDPPEATNPGAFCFVNTGEVDFEITLGGKTVSFPAKSTRVIEGEAPEDGGLVPFWVRKDPDEKAVYQTRLFCQPTKPSALFLYPPDEKTKRWTSKFL